MPKKKLVIENEIYILPSSNDDLTPFIKKFKLDMMEHVVDSIDYALKNNLRIIEVFQFKKSDYAVTISKPEYVKNLKNIYNYYKSNNIFELCPRVEELIKKTEVG